MAYGTIRVNEAYYVCTPTLSYVKELLMWLFLILVILTKVDQN